jgi:hypothetical protein
MARRVAARAIFDEHALDALAGGVRLLVLVDEGPLRVLLLRRIRTRRHGRPSLGKLDIAITPDPARDEAFDQLP